MHVFQRSYSGAVSTWRGARPLPDEEHMGWIPDALIPFQATPGNVDWIGGAPFAIGAGRNQGVWIDITIPRDAPSGSYRGTIRVCEGDRTTFRVPLVLEVYNFTLPDSTHFRSFCHFLPSLLERHPGIKNNSSSYWKLLTTYMKVFHRHRMDLTDGRRKLSDFSTRLGEYYTGSAYSRANGYDGPGLGVGNGVYSIGTYDQFDQGHRSGFVPVTEEGWQTAADAWEGWFLKHAPDVLRFKYMRDEPDSQRDTAYAYAEIRKRAAWLHNNPGIGRGLRTFCTIKIDPRLFGAIDIWSLTSQSGYDPGDGIPQGYIIQKADERRALGEEVGFYNGTRPAFGLLEWIDAFVADARINPWIAWKYHVDHYFLWESGFIYNKEHGEKQNVWVAPYSGGSPARIRWGIGTIVYTGNDDLYRDESRGIDGPIASIRMKGWRRGQQDYEYLFLARESGIDVTDISNTVVPNALDDYNGSTYKRQSNQPLWATRGYQFERARRVLADRLQRRAPSGDYTLQSETMHLPMTRPLYSSDNSP